MNNPNNHLSKEKSLYLRQHGDQPVNWYAWGEEAIEKAKKENKPIFLSIGYSSCHWCHVMSEESFDDQLIANVLNAKYIAIKVDREEFPDLDAYYQQASQFFNQAGGWPLSAFLLPDLRPYFVGTYFPKTPRQNMASFEQILRELDRVFHEEKENVEKNASQVVEALEKGYPHPENKIEFPDHFPSPISILKAVEEFADKDNGGYGGAPKFPHFAFYEWAVEQMLEGMIPQEAGKHIISTIENMLLGGMFDHVRGGIHRYSVDAKFLVPHFEKMLYDQAGLIRLLSKTAMLFPSVHIIDSLVKTLEYLRAEMLDDKGYFFSAQDADSEGHEGLYFTFTRDEFLDIANKVLEQENFSKLNIESDKVLEWFRISPQGNFENQLNVISLDPTLKTEYFRPDEWELVRNIYRELLLERKTRIPPATDNKGISSWNFHLITGLCDAIQYARVPVIREQATELLFKVLEGSHQHFFTKNDHSQKMILKHTTTLTNDISYVEDYVFYAESQLRAYEITGNITIKQNIIETLNYIYKEFVKEGKLFHRKINEDSENMPPNLEVFPFDQSFQSPLSTLFLITKRARVLFSIPELGNELLKTEELFKQQTLMSPIGCGAALRANTYPDQIYRVVKVPRTWLSNDQYLQFINFFMSRFVLDYHEHENEWQICNLNTCELQGEGIESFIETLRPKEKGNN